MTNVIKLTYEERKALAFRHLKLDGWRQTITMKRRAFIGPAGFSPTEARTFAHELENRGAADVATNLRAGANRIDAGERDDVNVPDRDPDYVCHGDCCTNVPMDS
ncbi:hypothetical protein ACFOOP_10285 [Marinicaulis aureus]|uniref:Uncharacterized protein n=1 Tax=Hyphococcus aureus TaxID=2666033 RepID=A0ABW1L3K6_9PROT